MDEQQSPIKHVEIQIVGPVTRATDESESPDPRHEALDDALHWIWSWRLQVRRIQESFEVEWRDGTPLERRRGASQFSFDEHIITVVGWNLVRAIQRAEPFLPTLSLPPREA